MTRPALEVADILRGHGPAWRAANRDHASLDQKSANQIVRRSAADESHDCLMTIRVGLPFSSLVIGLAALAHNGTPD